MTAGQCLFTSTQIDSSVVKSSSLPNTLLVQPAQLSLNPSSWFLGSLNMRSVHHRSSQQQRQGDKQEGGEQGASNKKKGRQDEAPGSEGVGY